MNEGVVLKSQLNRQTDIIIRRALQAEQQIALPPADILRETGTGKG